MEQKNKLIPELRFPEFMKDGEWEEVEFGKLKLDVSDGNYSSKYPTQSDFLHSGIPFIRSNNLKNGTIVDEDMRYISEEQHNIITKGHLKKGDILLSTRGELGTVALIPNRHIGSNINAQLVRINSHETLVNTFLLYLLELYKSSKVFDSLSTGTALKQLPIGKLNQIKIIFPDKKTEQQKIADCLSSLDDLLTAHTDKLEALQQHKKGLLQNLFPQEGQITPNYRFPEFANDGDWEEKKLGDNGVAVIVNEKISLNKLNLETYISTENMLSNFTGITVASKFPSSGSFTRFKVGDILISNIRPYLKKVWKSDKIGGASNDVIVFRPDTDVLGEFLEFIIKNEAFINYVMESAKGVKMPRGDKGSMLNYTVLIPSKKEQQKIADCLSAVDSLIIAQTEKIAQLKTHKKGLMQGLFPHITA